MRIRSVWSWVLCLGLLVSAANAKPTKAQWADAEAVMRAHFAAQKKELIDATQVEGLGTTFWVRYVGGGAGVALVRGKDVFTAPGAATISAVLKRDDFLKTRTITANDFWYLLDMLGHMPQTPGGSPLRDDQMKELNPAWTFDKEGALFTMYATRPAEPTGEPNVPTRPVTRAQLRVRNDYSLAPWVLEPIDHPIKKKR